MIIGEIVVVVVGSVARKTRKIRAAVVVVVVVERPVLQELLSFLSGAMFVVRLQDVPHHGPPLCWREVGAQRGERGL